jgi:hypothetical protein
MRHIDLVLIMDCASSFLFHKLLVNVWVMSFIYLWCRHEETG